MATSREYAGFILEQCKELEVSARKMMGEYVLYYRGKVFGGLYDDRLMVKITKASRSLLPQAPEEPPYQEAKPMLSVEPVDDRAFLQQLVREMFEELPYPKAKKRK